VRWWCRCGAAVVQRRIVPVSAGVAPAVGARSGGTVGPERQSVMSAGRQVMFNGVLSMNEPGGERTGVVYQREPAQLSVRPYSITSRTSGQRPYRKCSPSGLNKNVINQQHPPKGK